MALARLQGLYDIDVECPFIHPTSLQFYQRKGWRWEGNLDTEFEWSTNGSTIRALQERYGRLNVALGYPKNEETEAFRYTSDMVGVYVREDGQ